MSHEIRTPMNGILGFAELLKEPDLTGEQQKRFIGIIEKSGQRMLNIINDLINISKIEAGQMEITNSETNVDDLVKSVFHFFEPETHKKGLEFSYSIDSRLKTPQIITDREKLYAVLVNLIKNAIKYTHEGSIRFGYLLKKGDEDDYLEFFVKDTGIGIPREKQDVVFERFIQADNTIAKPYEGAGLGLSISKGYVEMMGGSIWLESQPGKGSSFYFTLPVPSQVGAVPVDETIENETEDMKDGFQLKVLIAEDTEFSDVYLSQVLKHVTREILHAANGREAVRLMRENQDTDLVLMDIKMPEMDGYEATREIRKFNKEVIIIAQTAYAMLSDREKALEAGCNSYLSKPVKRKDVMAEIERFFLSGKNIPAVTG